MEVLVQVGDQSMKIACGEGTQSVRWLALVAAQRLQLLQPNGRSRMRERDEARRGFVLPQAVLLKDHGILDDPEATIKEVMQDGAQVEVILMEEVKVDEIGAPMESEWFLKAFGVGEATKRRLNGARLREEYAAKVDSDDKKLVSDQGWGGVVPGFDWRGGRGYAGGFDVTVEGVVISGPLETVGQIRVAMEHDWRSADIGGILNDPEESAMVKELLQANLPALNQIYASRSGGECAAEMSFNDFAHLLHRCGVMPDSDRQGGAAPMAATRKVFDHACRGTWPGNGKALNRAQFLAALVLAARSKGLGKTAEHLKRLVEGALLPSHAEAIEDDIGVEINRMEVQRYVSDNRRLLYSVYLMYAEPSDDGAFITLDHFRELMDGCGITTAISDIDQFALLSETCFLKVQGQSPLSALVFTECIEAACRLAVMSVDSISSSSVQAPHRCRPSHEDGLINPRQKKMDAIFLMVDSIIDLGLGDRGTPK